MAVSTEGALSYEHLRNLPLGELGVLEEEVRSIVEARRRAMRRGKP